MPETWVVGGTIVWLVGWFGGIRGYLKERLARRQFEAAALTNRTAATYLYPLMGPDHLFRRDSIRPMKKVKPSSR